MRLFSYIFSNLSFTFTFLYNYFKFEYLKISFIRKLVSDFFNYINDKSKLSLSSGVIEEQKEITYKSSSLNDHESLTFHVKKDKNLSSKLEDTNSRSLKNEESKSKFKSKREILSPIQN